MHYRRVIVMTTSHRNLFVGQTVLAGLLILGWMILEFGGVMARPFAGPQTSITFTAERADGIGAGAPVLFRGISVGQVTGATVADDLGSVIITARLAASARVPANVVGLIRPQGLMSGGNAIFLELTTSVPTGQISDGAKLEARLGTLDLLPRQFAELAEDLRLTSKHLRESGVVQHLDETLQQATRQLAQAGDVMKNVNALVGDPQVKKDLQASAASLKDVMAASQRIAGNVEKFTTRLEGVSDKASTVIEQAGKTFTTAEARVEQVATQVGDRLTQVAAVLQNFEQVTSKMNKGEGTAALMLNDPKLYQAMVDSARQMNLVMADLKRVIEQWEQEGVRLKLR
jgi:phospholipid/cholesterol/gamma-HCH transport system substrate-binding protein